jgi:hypothetical protein
MDCKKLWFSIVKVFSVPLCLCGQGFLNRWLKTTTLAHINHKVPRSGDLRRESACL